MSAGEDSGRHAVVRAFERYGITISQEGLRDLEERLRAGEGMILRKDPVDGTEQRVIRLEGQLVTVVVSQMSRRILTFLPADAPYARRWGR